MATSTTPGESPVDPQKQAAQQAAIDAAKKAQQEAERRRQDEARKRSEETARQEEQERKQREARERERLQRERDAAAAERRRQDEARKRSEETARQEERERKQREQRERERLQREREKAAEEQRKAAEARKLAVEARERAEKARAEREAAARRESAERQRQLEADAEAARRRQEAAEARKVATEARERVEAARAEREAESRRLQDEKRRQEEKDRKAAEARALAVEAKERSERARAQREAEGRANTERVQAKVKTQADDARERQINDELLKAEKEAGPIFIPGGGRPGTKEQEEERGKEALESIKDQTPFLGTYRAGDRLVDNWNDISNPQKARDSGLLALSVLGDLALVAGVTLKVRATVRGGSSRVTTATSTSADELADLAESAAKQNAKVSTVEVVAGPDDALRTQAVRLAEKSPPGAQFDVISNTSPSSLQQAARIARESADALPEGAKPPRVVIELDKPLTPTELNALADEIQAATRGQVGPVAAGETPLQELNVVIRSVDRSLSEQAIDDIVKARVNAKAKFDKRKPAVIEAEVREAMKGQIDALSTSNADEVAYELNAELRRRAVPSQYERISFNPGDATAATSSERALRLESEPPNTGPSRSPGGGVATKTDLDVTPRITGGGVKGTATTSPPATAISTGTGLGRSTTPGESPTDPRRQAPAEPKPSETGPKPGETGDGGGSAASPDPEGPPVEFPEPKPSETGPKPGGGEESSRSPSSTPGEDPRDPTRRQPDPDRADDPTKQPDPAEKQTPDPKKEPDPDRNSQPDPKPLDIPRLPESTPTPTPDPTPPPADNPDPIPTPTPTPSEDPKPDPDPEPQPNPSPSPSPTKVKEDESRRRNVPGLVLFGTAEIQKIELSPGTYPAQVQWKQGQFYRQVDLNTGKETTTLRPVYGGVNPGVTPRQTLKVIAISRRKPKKQKFRVGAFIATVGASLIQFEPSPAPSPYLTAPGGEEHAPRQPKPQTGFVEAGRRDPFAEPRRRTRRRQDLGFGDMGGRQGFRP